MSKHASHTDEKTASGRTFAIIVSFLALAVFSCMLAGKLPVMLYPSDMLPTLSVSYSLPGAPASMVDRTVTSPLEGMLARIAGVREITSRSESGYGEVILSFDDKTDMSHARFEAASVIRAAYAHLPSALSYPVINVGHVVDEAASPFMIYTLTSSLPDAEVAELARRTVLSGLASVEGVARAELSGVSSPVTMIQYDPERLHQFGLRKDDLTEALDRYLSGSFPGSTFSASDSAAVLQIQIPAIYSTDSIRPEKIAVANVKGHIVTLDKVARVTSGRRMPERTFRLNGRPAIYINIYARPDANQLAAAAEVRRIVAQNTPEGVTARLSLDRTDDISRQITDICFRTGITLLILLAFVGLTTMSLRYLAVIAISMLVNLAIATGFYYFAGVEIQIYSLAGLTISLNLLIDNLIVMTESYCRSRRAGVFTAILAATLTTIGALGAIFLFDNKLSGILYGFAAVIIINLCVSLLVALFFVPALSRRLGLSRKGSHHRAGKLRQSALRAYARLTACLCRHKAWLYTVYILAFGIPVFLLPEKVGGDSCAARLYNSTIGSQLYQEKIRKIIDPALGGSMRLFAEKVYTGNYFRKTISDPVINVTAIGEAGLCDAAVRRIENLTARASGGQSYQTTINESGSANILITFTADAQGRSSAGRLYDEITAKALATGGVEWIVGGLDRPVFSTRVAQQPMTHRICLKGYDFERLTSLSSALRDSLLSLRRINEVATATSPNNVAAPREISLTIDHDKLSRSGISAAELVSALDEYTATPLSGGSSGSPDNIELVPSPAEAGLWGLLNRPISIGDRNVKLGDIAHEPEGMQPASIVKEDRCYLVYLLFNYVGDDAQARRVVGKLTEQFNTRLPLGYKATYHAAGYDDDQENTPYMLLVLIVVIIFFIASILFDSLRMPFAIILIAPASFIGVFLTFAVTGNTFGQGGFASFVLLSGITVNSAIYIVGEYLRLLRRHPYLSRPQAYAMAFRSKITAIFLTAISTVLGFIPFLIGTGISDFWSTLAIATIGGEMMGFVSIILLLPALVMKK